MSSTIDFYTVIVKCPFCGEEQEVFCSKEQDNKTGEVNISPKQIVCISEDCGMEFEV